MTKEQFDPSDFYEVARTLLVHSRDESHLRTAIGRAYYTCFHLARLACQRKWSSIPPEHGRHRAVARKLTEQGLRYHARQLRRLLDLREHADYDLEAPVDQVLCDEAMTLASWLIPRLRSL